jgi:cytoskeletal protein RodZ
MPLTGELSDLSLAELIEFFCNQRKTGRLKVTYSIGPGYFYLQSGSVVHARIGVLRGIEAVYCALTLPNASFNFSPAFEAPEQTINQPWTSVVLEGLRRMDEGVQPGDPFPERSQVQLEEPKAEQPEVPAVVAEEKVESVPVVLPQAAEEVPARASVEAPVAAAVSNAAVMGSFLSQESKSARFGFWKLAAVIAAVVLIVGAVGLPWGWYARSKAAKLSAQPQPAPAENSQAANLPAPTTEATEAPANSESSAPATANDAAGLAAKRARDARARLKAQETAAFPATPQATPATVAATVVKPQVSPVAGSRKATVQVTYDENGRVTQASGGDATALRIARQKRFPAGKAGSATVTIPIN